MRPKMVWRIARKEILSTLRDTRAIISNLLIPLLLMPVMMLGLPLLLGGLFQREAVTITPIGVEGVEFLPPELVTLLKLQNVQLDSYPDALAAVQEDRVTVAMKVEEPLAVAIAEGRTPRITLVTKAGNMKSELNAAKVQQAVTFYQRQVVAERLTDAGLDPNVLDPLLISMVDASSDAERSSGQLSWLIPFFIAIWTLTGGQMTAIDATAGEKERGTLEVLLVAPVRRSEVVVGKFLATLTFGLSAAVMAIVGFLLGGVALKEFFVPRLGEGGAEIVQFMGGALNIDAAALGVLFLSALLLASFVAALLISIALFARSFKEAQSYLAPLSFLFIIPALMLQFKDLINVGDVAFMIPVYNVLVLMDNVVRGNYALSEIGISWAIMLALIWLLLAFAHRNFQREEVIFRS